MQMFGQIIVRVYNIILIITGLLSMLPIIGIIAIILNWFIMLQYSICNFFLQLPLNLLSLFGSRQNEYEADEYACEIGLGPQLYTGLYHIQGMMGQGGASFLGDFFSTHPGTEKRLAHIREILGIR